MTNLRACLRSLVLALAVAGAIAPAYAAPPDDATKALIGKNLVDIGGRRLNLICIGEGSPTVVFEQGLGSNLLHWQHVAGPVSKFARACFYDRAGHAFSNASGRAGDAANATDDLHNLLQRASVKPPLSSSAIRSAAFSKRFTRTASWTTSPAWF